MAKSNDKTHQTNWQQLSYTWLGTSIFKCRKWLIESGFIALNLSLVWQSHQIPLYLRRCVNKHNRYNSHNMVTAVITVLHVITCILLNKARQLSSRVQMTCMLAAYQYYSENAVLFWTISD